MDADDIIFVKNSIDFLNYTNEKISQHFEIKFFGKIKVSSAGKWTNIKMVSLFSRKVTQRKLSRTVFVVNQTDPGRLF